LRAKLKELSRVSKRSMASHIEEGLFDYVDYELWATKRIRAALDEVKSGAPLIPHEDVMNEFRRKIGGLDKKRKKTA